jgi:hypothetical protein
MSGLAERVAIGPAFIGAFVLVAACAQASAAHRNPHPTAHEQAQLKSAYFQWRRAETCAMHGPAGPIRGAKKQVRRAKAVLSQAAAGGLKPLIDAIDAEYRRIDAMIDWVCSDPKGLRPEGIRADRLARLRSAVDRLARAVGMAIARS